MDKIKAKWRHLNACNLCDEVKEKRSQEHCCCPGMTFVFCDDCYEIRFKECDAFMMDNIKKAREDSKRRREEYEKNVRKLRQ